jgi:hypothetical protein
VTTPDLEFICQQHESFLNDLEDLAVETICASPKGRRLGRSQQRFAIAKNDWTAFSAHLINFQNEHDHHGESGIAITEKFYRVQLLDTYKRIEASTKDLSRPGADLLPDQTNDLGDFSIMAPYTQYVADHINQISGVHAGHPDRIRDSKWRIASCLGLFKDLDPTGRLTTQQVEVIDTYITKFLSTSVGQEAIAYFQGGRN